MLLLLVGLAALAVLLWGTGNDDDATPVDEMGEVLSGCTDPTALNYDSTADMNDDSCEYEATLEPEEDDNPDPPEGNETELAEQARATIDLWEGENRLLLNIDILTIGLTPSKVSV